MKTKRLKNGIAYDTPQKNYIKSVMYEFDFDTSILVTQKQVDGSNDYTFLHYFLKEGDKAYFSEEYLPVGVRKEGVKKPDITAIIENENELKIKWFIYDMKDTVIDVKVAGKLCSQWHRGIENISKEYLDSKSTYNIEDSLGVITRHWDKDELKNKIHTYEQRLNELLSNKNPLLTAKKSLTIANEYKERIRAAQNIIDGIYEDYDEISGDRKTYKIHYVYLVETEPLLYTVHMGIKL